MEEMPKFWYDIKESEECAKLIFATVVDLKKKQDYHYRMNERHIRLYGNYKAMGLDLESDDDDTFDAPRATLNLIQQCVDSAQAKIAKNRPRPRFLTEAGQYSLKRKGQKLGKFLEGVYYDCDTYQKAQQCFSDGGILGTGALKFVISERKKKKKIKHERVLSHKLVIDTDETRNGQMPKTLYQIEYISKYELARKYKKKKEICLKASKLEDDQDLFYAGLDTACVPVVEAWRIGSEEEPGRHVICVSSGELFSEDWKHEEVPFEFFHFRPRQIGFWGQGIAEINTGAQVSINRALIDIQDIVHIGCVPKIFVQNGSNVVSSHFNNTIGTMIKFDGERPTYDQLLHVPPELWDQVTFWYQKGFEAIGLNAMTATGAKPQELQSGKALREYNDIESERFAIIAQDYERFHINIWKHTLKYAEEIAKEDKNYSVLSLNQNGSEKIIWRDVRLEEDQAILQVFPTNLLSKDPSGRMDDVKMLLDMQMIDVEEGLGLLEFPDTENFYKMKNAIRSSIEAIIEKIIDKGEYETPSALYGPEFLEKGSILMRNCYFYFKNEGLELSKLELFTRWINDSMGIIEEQAATAAPPITEPGLPNEMDQSGLPVQQPQDLINQVSQP